MEVLPVIGTCLVSRSAKISKLVSNAPKIRNRTTARSQERMPDEVGMLAVANGRESR